MPCFDDVTRLSILDLRAGLARGDLDPKEVLVAHRERAGEVASSHNAFTAMTAEGVTAGGPLRGIPIAVKDVFRDRGRPPTMGSRVHAPSAPGGSALLDRARELGATILGYTNLHEWAIGTTSTVTATGPIRNPWDPERIAGGSSGGSAVAVATGAVPAAIGSDAGGSVRIPAACCGVVGLKPTFGALSLEGEVSGTSPVNHAGLLTRTVADARFLFDVLAGRSTPDADLHAVTLGTPSTFFFDNVDPQVAATVRDASRLVGTKARGIRRLDVAGLEESSQAISEVQLPLMAEIVARDIDKRPESFDPWTLKALLRGRAMGSPSVDLVPFREAWRRVFEDCEVVAVPTLPAVAPRIDDHKVQLPSGPEVADLAQYALNAPMNTGGVPALAVPCGRVDGMPVSVTFVAPWNREDILFAVGAALEEAVGFMRPPSVPES